MELTRELLHMKEVKVCFNVNLYADPCLIFKALGAGGKPKGSKVQCKLLNREPFKTDM